MAEKLYIVYNSAVAGAAAPVKQPTGTAIRTMMQLVPAAGVTIRVVEWGCSFDGFAAAAPGQVELIDTLTVFATGLSTAYGVNDIQPFNDAQALANTAGTSGIPLNLGTSFSGFSTAAVTEGVVTGACRSLITMLPPTAPYEKQFPLGREFEVPAGHALRIRATFGTTVNMSCYVIFSV